MIDTNKHVWFFEKRAMDNKLQRQDLNGARNILKKYLYQIDKTIEGSIGSVAEPLIWRCNNVIPS